MPRNNADDLNAASNIQRVDALEDKVERCFSADRYEIFQDAVEKITLKTIGAENGGEKIKKHAEDYFKGKVGWAVLIWLITLVASMLLQRFFHVLG